MITRDHETIVMPDRAFQGLVWAYRCAVSALRKAGAAGAANAADEKLALYTDWICGDQPQLQAEFFTKYFDKMFDPARIGALIYEDLAERLKATVDKQNEADLSVQRRAEWIAQHPERIR